jgi:hypothetical protein
VAATSGQEEGSYTVAKSLYSTIGNISPPVFIMHSPPHYPPSTSFYWIYTYIHVYTCHEYINVYIHVYINVRTYLYVFTYRTHSYSTIGNGNRLKKNNSIQNNNLVINELENMRGDIYIYIYMYIYICIYIYIHMSINIEVYVF